jgi:hypothetical protein
VSLPARMEELWAFLYEHGYIQMQDVLLQQKWIAALIKAGYRFPPILSDEESKAAWATKVRPRAPKVRHL